MDLLLQQLADGVSTGALYGAMALAIVMVHRASGLVNFAQGEMAMIGAFVAWQANASGLPLIAAVCLAVVVSALGGAAVDRLLVRPFSSFDSQMPVIIMTLGLMLILNSAAGVIWGYQTKEFPRIFGAGAVDLGPVAMSRQSVGIVLTVIVMSGLMFYLFQRTRLGLFLRAAVDNPDSARLSGVPVGRTTATSWAIGAAIGAVVGVLVAPILFLQPNMMSTMLLYAFAAATLGGIDSPIGAIVGGVIVGVLENLAGTYVDWIGNDFKQGVALLVILAALMLKPEGLFGERAVVRV